MACSPEPGGIFYFMASKKFNAPGIFWQLTVENKDGEILFFKNEDTEPFYYFGHEDYKMNYERWEEHLKEKSWFTDKVLTFINAQIMQA